MASLNERLSDAINDAMDGDVLAWGLPEFCQYRSGCADYDYDLSGGALAALNDVVRLHNEGHEDAVAIVQDRMEKLHAACLREMEKEG